MDCGVGWQAWRSTSYIKFIKKWPSSFVKECDDLGSPHGSARPDKSPAGTTVRKALWLCPCTVASVAAGASVHRGAKSNRGAKPLLLIKVKVIKAGISYL